MILDTSVLVDLLRGWEETQRRVRGLEETGQLLHVPTPAIFELFEVVERSDRPSSERRQVQSVLDGYTVLEMGLAHARRAGEISGQLVRRGEMLDPVDVQIAGIALEEDRAILARDAEDFERVPGLPVEAY